MKDLIMVILLIIILFVIPIYVGKIRKFDSEIQRVAWIQKYLPIPIYNKYLRIWIDWEKFADEFYQNILEDIVAVDKNKENLKKALKQEYYTSEDARKILDKVFENERLEEISSIECLAILDYIFFKEQYKKYLLKKYISEESKDISFNNAYIWMMTSVKFTLYSNNLNNSEKYNFYREELGLDYKGKVKKPTGRFDSMGNEIYE